MPLKLAEGSRKDGKDDGQAQTAPGELPSIPSADHEPELEAVPAPAAAAEMEPAAEPESPESEHGAYLEADDDGDSAFGNDNDDETITASLTDSIREYRVENGRTYHGHHEGEYGFPNDELERDRLDLQHHLHRLTLDQRLYVAPIRKDIQNVLDIGTGTGLWAMEFADEHPSALVIGTDLSPIQATFVPPNLSFIIDDANESWIFKQKFDFIHARELHCAVDERKLIAQSLENLQPGGWLEMVELSLPVCDDDNTITPDHPIYKWSQLMLEASHRINKRLDNPPKYSQWMRDAGFVNVQHEIFKWPNNPWPRDKKHKTLGLWSLANTLNGLEGFTMAYFTRILGWKPEEVQVFLVGVREDNKNRRLHAYHPIHVVYGQRPESYGGQGGQEEE